MRPSLKMDVSSGNSTDAELPLFVGVDVGGTNTKIGLVDDSGRTLAFGTMQTEREQGPENVCQRIGQVARHLASEVGVAIGDVARVGLATPGSMDIPAGMLLCPGNLPGWWNFPIRDCASHHTGRPVTFANDGNAAAYGEYWRGNSASAHSLILLTLGTGIGGGIIIGGNLIEGKHGCGSECGHILIDFRDNARRDSLDKCGTLEAYTSAGAIVERTHEALDAGQESSLAVRRAAGDEIAPQIIAEEAERGDRLARLIVLDTAHYLAIGIVTLIHAIDPESVMIGGAMTFGGPESPLGREFLQRIRDDVRPRLLSPLRDKIRIDFASLGGDAGYIGAAGLARLEHLKQHPRGIRGPQFLKANGATRVGT